ncbi:MAG: enoyl-CoA hydratase [Kiloniellaceae bacterium]|nr:enoyl-CoA hydratase [Kiloniellaceae bacterium]
MSEELLYELRDGIGIVTFNRPAARNALTFAMYEGLAEICETAADKGEAKALVLRGAGDKAFAAGTDIAQFRAFKTAEDALAYEQRIDKVLAAVERCPLPTVAALAGACTGGGAGIAAACDIRIAARDLKFGFPIARTLGNCLSARNLARLSALIGAGRTREIIFTSRLVGAEEAQAAGLISELLHDRAALEARALDLAGLLAGQAPLTLRATKEALRRLSAAAADIDDKDLIVLCYTSEDFREGLEAFLAKRKPDWQGR